MTIPGLVQLWAGGRGAGAAASGAIAQEERRGRFSWSLEILLTLRVDSQLC